MMLAEPAHAAVLAPPDLHQALSCARHRNLGCGLAAAALAVVLVDRHHRRTDCASCAAGYPYTAWPCRVGGWHLHTGHRRVERKDGVS